MKKFIIVCFLFLGLYFSCNLADEKKDYSIDLLWVKSYPKDTQNKTQIGLKWILSYLGADLNNKNYEKAISWNNNILTVDLSNVGFTPKALNSIGKILSELKQRPEYVNHGYLHIGYFVMQIFNNSWHYYAITDMPKSLQEFKSQYRFDTKDDFFLLPGESGVTKGCRVFNIAKGDFLDELAFIAKEGKGSGPEDFHVEEFEVFDIMPNGQPRFAIYENEGNLKSAANNEISNAGKPAKCMWCHESRVQPLFKAKTDVEGYGSLKDFRTLIAKRNTQLKNQTMENKPLFFWENEFHHSFAELLYFTYEQPTLKRLRAESKLLGKELKIDSSKVEPIHEYDFLKIKFDSTINRKYTNLDHDKELHNSRDRDDVVSNFLSPN